MTIQDKAERDRAFDRILDRCSFPDTEGLDPQIADEKFHDECWEWTGTVTKGRNDVKTPIIEVRQGPNERNFTSNSARRLLYELYYDIDLEPGEHVILQCDSTTNLCMNPEHFKVRGPKPVRQGPQKLSLVNRMADQLKESTQSVKKPRKAPNRKRAYKACKNGHKYEEGSYTVDEKGWRHCRICRSASWKRMQEKANTSGKPLKRYPKRAKWREKAIEYLKQV